MASEPNLKTAYMQPMIPSDESERLRALHSYEVLDTPPEQRLDDITLLASQICATPIALVSLVDENRQWFKSRHGLNASETPRDVAFCAHAIHESQVFIVEDALEDPRFMGNPLVLGQPKVRFYAGAQLKTPSGYNIGTLCVIDHEAKKLSPKQIATLEALARQVVANFERSRLEKALKDRENFLANILGVVPDLISYIDSNYCFQFANQAFSQWFMVEVNAVFGLPISSLFGKNAFDIVKPMVDRAILGERLDCQTTLPLLIHGQATTKHVIMHFIPDKSEQGQVRGLFSVISDVTELKESERRAIDQSVQIELALQKSVASEASFKAIFENSPIGILRINSLQQMVSTNASFCSLVGFSVAELSHRSLPEFVHPSESPSIKDRLKLLNASGSGVNRLETRFLHRSGSTVWGLVTVRVVRQEPGSDYFFIATVEDITEVKAKDAALQEAQGKLFTASKLAALGEMAGGIAHEINSPLTIIKGNAELVLHKLSKESFDRAKAIAHLQVIRTIVDRIAKIVNGLRLFSSESDGQPMTPCSLSGIIASSMDLGVERFISHGVAISLVIKDDVMVQCQSMQIAQIVTNLLNNSYDAIAGSAEKWIEIEALWDSRTASIRVTDSGSGIPGEVVERMMNPFFTTKEIGKGTGLGLSIAKGIAEAHQGTLTYEIRDGHTSFILTLPLKQLAKAMGASGPNKQRVA